MDEMQDEVRTRTITWNNPEPVLAAARTMSGMAYLQAILTGELPAPPAVSLIGMRIVDVDEGRVTFTLEPAEYHYNPLGTVHGGISATLLDTAMGCAVQSRLPAGTSYTTLELKVNYIRPITTTTGMMICEGSVIHLGGRIATAQAQVNDSRGKLYAHSTTTCILFHPS